jgi:hypothetical protein
MLSGRTPTLIGETLEGSVAKGHPQRGILLPLLCCLVVNVVIEGLDGSGCYTLGCALSSSAENSQLLSYRFFRRFCVWNNSGVIEISLQSFHKSFSTRINIL